MKIRSIHLTRVGPMAERSLDFSDAWVGGVNSRVLFSGPNGSGKSTILRAAAYLWSVMGNWLSTPGVKAKSSLPSVKWLSRWGATAMLLDDVPGVGSLGLFWGDPSVYEILRSHFGGIHWIGETRSEPKGPGRPARVLLHEGTPWLHLLAASYRELVLNDKGEMPNIIHLDGEERRWVVPIKGLGEVVPDDPQLRWLVGYRANEEWKGQLEASLIALKTVDPQRFKQVLEDLNALLRKKTISPDPDKTTLRLHVRTDEGRTHSWHGLDELSAGEHQVLIQLYLVSRWLRPGGVVMIDEPDLHLHPSLVNAFLTRLETLVESRNGQLLLTSHNPELWSRYESKGLRVMLEVSGSGVSEKKLGGDT